MDAGVAAIVAASIATVAGGAIGFASSYFTSRQHFAIDKKRASLPRQMDSAEFVGMILLKNLSNNSVETADIDKYISCSYWLPEALRLECLAAISDSADEECIKRAHSHLIDFFDSLTGGR